MHLETQIMKKKGEFKVDIEDINGDGFDDIEGKVKIKDLVALGQASQDDDQIYARLGLGDHWMTFVDDRISIV